MKIELEVSDANEGTFAPWWMIINPMQNFKTDSEASHNIAAMITGPFFSREEAEAVLASARYRYGNGACVYCASGHATLQYRQEMTAAKGRKRSHDDD
jgi:hypothetical protein